MSLLPDEVETPEDYIKYLYVIHGKKLTKAQLKAREGALKRLAKAFGYNKLDSVQIGLEGSDFVNNGITFVIKARKN